MASDDLPSGSEPDRRHLLDEIRRRAEEAELRRIEEEEEERKRSQEEIPPPAPRRPAKESRRPEEPLPMPPPLPKRILQEQKSNVLRERLLIALDRGKTEKAATLLDELTELVPDEPELEMFRSRLAAMQEETKKTRERKKAPEPRPKGESPEEKAEREARKKKTADLLEKANSLYQQEKYEQGLKALDEIANLDPSHEEAKRLREQVERAKSLADQIRAEEARRKAEESAVEKPPVEEPPVPAARDGDFWGSTHVVEHRDEFGIDLPPEEKGPVGPPKAALANRLIDRMSKVKIPVKPVMTVVVLILIVVSAWVIVDHIRNAVSPPRFCLLIFPAIPSGDSTAAYIAAGLSDDLARDFSQIGEMRVVGPVTGATLVALSRTPLQSARSVGANYFMQWSVGKSGDVIVLQPKLYDTLAAAPVWTAQNQVSLRELPALRHEMVRKLATAMQVNMSDEEETELQAIPTSNASAYDSYLIGRMMLGQRDDFPLDGALHEFELATAADSGFADAQSALGWTHILSYETEPVPKASHLAQALLCCEHALARDPRSSEAYRVLGMVNEFRGDFDKAIEEFEESTNYAPSDAESQRRLAIAYVAKGLADDALKAAQRAVTVDPGDVESYNTLGLIQQYRSDYKGAAESFEQALRLARDRTEYSGGLYADMFVYIQQPDRSVDILLDRVARFRQSFVDYYRLGRVEQSAGRPIGDWQNAFVRSRELIEARLQENPDDAYALTYLALAQTRLGEFRLALNASARALKIAPNDVDVLLNTARMYALQRDKKQALEYLGKYLHFRYNLRAVLDMDFYNLHSDEEFIATVTM